MSLMKKRILGLALILGFISMSAFALLPENQWFSTVDTRMWCSKVCYDPATGIPNTISWQAYTCKFSYIGSCTPYSCSLSCIQLMQIGVL